MSKRPQTRRRFQAELVQALSVHYLLFLPDGYDASGSRRWPLMLFLHGAGERGKDVWKVAQHGPPKLVEQQPDFPFVLVSPQCPAGQQWSDPLLLALLEHIVKDFAIDSHRIYLTGLSMGGYACWSLALERPELFAAVAPICGGGNLLPILLAEPKTARALRKLPVWAFHGAKDPAVPLEESERMVASLRQIGNKARLTIYPDAGHDAWTETYRNPTLYDWFLDQRRSVRRKIVSGQAP